MAASFIKYVLRNLLSIICFLDYYLDNNENFDWIINKDKPWIKII